jgi:hypothetical protein
MRALLGAPRKLSSIGQNPCGPLAGNRDRDRRPCEGFSNASATRPVASARTASRPSRDADARSGLVAQASKDAEKLEILSFRAKRGISLFLGLNRREIPRFARNDKINSLFRSLFSRWVLIFAQVESSRSMTDTHYARQRQRSTGLSRGCAIISRRLVHRAEFSFVFREAKRNSTMMSADRSKLSRRAVLFLFVLIGVPGVVRSSTLEDSAKELARKIAAALPAGQNVSCEIRNISSLKPGEAARIEQALKAELEERGIRLTSEEAAITVVVMLSENFKEHVWTGEIRRGDASQVVLIDVEPSLENRASSNGMPVTIRSEKIWEGREHILDAATMNSSDGGSLLLLLTVNGVLITKNGTDASPRFSFQPIQAVLRDPAGTLTQAGNEVTATMPQQTCIFSLDPDGLSQCRPAKGPPTGRDYDTLQQLIPPAPPHPEWGSQIQEIQSRCGSGAQFLVTGPGDYTQTDFIQLFGPDLTQHRPTGKPLSNQLAFAGPVMDLHADGTGARAVVRNLETGSYEAYRISIECGR